MMLRGSVASFIIFLTVFVLAPKSHSLTEPCGLPALTAEGNFFTNYESVEYSPEGNLIYHFRIDPALASGSTNFQIEWAFFDDECKASISGAARSPFLRLPAGVSEWSVRVISPSIIAVWDDQNNAQITSFSIPAYPPYARLLLRGFAPAAFSRIFESRTVRMFENSEAPVFENTAAKPDACPELAVQGSLFDSYEKAEYVDGLLRVHVRFGRFAGGSPDFFSKVLALGENCVVTKPPFGGINTSFPSIVRYFSFRMISPTEWQLWDDDRDKPLVCSLCAGSIASSTPYVAFYGLVNGNFGPLEIRTTPFPPTIETEQEVPDPVIIIPGILGSEKNSDGEWVIDPILHTYDDLIATLDVNHYTPGVDLFTFPYDWRKSNINTAILLKEKIDEIKTICECEKVDLVTHSMGGLVARQYIQSEAYENDVDQLIFLGTPHLGAPKAYLMWEGGELSPINDFFDELSEKFLEHEAYEKGYPSLFAYIHTESIDSIRELLPTYDYIFDDASLRSYPNNYPPNLFLEGLNNEVDLLLNSGVEIHNIIGHTSVPETITAIQATDPQAYLPMWANGYPEGFYDLFGDHGLIQGIGDKTVPLPSASFINGNSSSISSVHQTLPEAAEGNIYQILTGETAVTLVDNWNIPNAKIILFQIFSPADILVVDPRGNKVGKENGQEVNQIPGAFYSGFDTETEYITILNPLDGEYQIVTEGTDGGAYTVETSYITESTTTEASFTGNTVSGLVTELGISVNSEHPEDLQILPADSEPPQITVVSPDARDYLRSEKLAVDVSVEDEESGVYSLVTELDGLSVPNHDSTDLFFQSLGEHFFFASSTDNVGNVSTATATFRIIATLESTLSDVERAFALGWMVQSVRDKIVEKLQVAFAKQQNEQEYGKFLSKDILNELERRRGNGITEQGYQLLTEDILWVINN